ncbi:MAG: flavin reductase family protein [Planctomycetota bacterium]|nr:MAG: flavin reductase family protein [Planctomycetota bacterium]REJ86957.1 MAG: flavin reductase family protein [Planctomycetota bacterium]
MLIDPADISPRDMYLHMVRAITPRPIAWVSTISAEGVANLAPYSFFNGVSANPPSVVFSPVNRRDGSKKDTVLNIEATREFVVNVVPHQLAEAMNATSATFAPELSEFAECGLTPIDSQRVRAPRLAESPIQMECTLLQIVHIGEGPLAANLIIGKIELMHVADDILDGEGQIDPAKIDTIGRLGGASYTTTRERFDMPRLK